MHNRFGDEEGFRLIKESGFDAVDYSFCGVTDKEAMLGDGYIEYALKTRALLDENGLVCTQENIGKKDERRGCTVARYGAPKSLYKLLKALNSPWFVVCVDVGHAAYGVGPLPEELIEGLDNQVLRCLHIHDNDCRHDGHALPYTGNLNWEKITTALKKLTIKEIFHWRQSLILANLIVS